MWLNVQYQYRSHNTYLGIMYSSFSIIWLLTLFPLTPSYIPHISNRFSHNHHHYQNIFYSLRPSLSSPSLKKYCHNCQGWKWQFFSLNSRCHLSYDILNHILSLFFSWICFISTIIYEISWWWLGSTLNLSALSLIRFRADLIPHTL